MIFKKDTIFFFEERVMQFYREKGREHLPWRKNNIMPYEVWVSEIMLQQTQVDRVIGFYTKFLKRFPMVEKLAEASWEEFLPYYQGLGYYNRGRNMLKTAQKVMQEYGGKFPIEVAELESLPGIGKYTARAIASFAKNSNYLSWDTNFARVFGRFFAGSKNAALKPDDFEGKIHADKRDFNGAIMDFGSLVCVKKPKCGECLMASKCVYFQRGGIEEREIKKETKKFPAKEAEARIFLHKNHKVYYSERADRYEPFRIPSTRNTREGIQKYFREWHGLEVSVRPAHKRTFINGVPVIFVNAQILLGEKEFFEFKKEDVKNF